MNPRVIKFNRFQSREHAQMKHNIFKLRLFSKLLLGIDSRPIVNSKPTWPTLFDKSSYTIGQCLFVGGVPYHQQCRTTLNVLQNLISWAIDIRGQTARCVRTRGARLSGAMGADVENLGWVAQLMTINPTGASATDN